MSTTVSGNFSLALKNKMLDNGLTGVQDLRVQALNATDQTRSNQVVITFDAAASGERSIASSVSLTVTSGSSGTDAVKKIKFFSISPGLDWVVFEISQAIDFPDGGSLVINDLTLKLDDPS
jgi:hypothetical protein